MLNDEPPKLDPSEVERVYRNYLAVCARLGVKPMPRERAAELIREWAAALERRDRTLH